MDLAWSLKGLLLLLTTWSCGKKEDIFPSNSVIAQAMGCQKRSVQQRLKTLESLGLITVTRKGTKRLISLNIKGVFLSAPKHTSSVPECTPPCTPVHPPVHTSAPPLYIGSEETREETKKETRAEQRVCERETTSQVVTPALPSSLSVSSGQGERSQAVQALDLWRKSGPTALKGLTNDRAYLALAWVYHKAVKGSVSAPSKILGLVLGDLKHGLKGRFTGFVESDLYLMTGECSPLDLVMARGQERKSKASGESGEGDQQDQGVVTVLDPLSSDPRLRPASAADKARLLSMMKRMEVG